MRRAAATSAMAALRRERLNDALDVSAALTRRAWERAGAPALGSNETQCWVLPNPARSGAVLDFSTVAVGPAWLEVSRRGGTACRAPRPGNVASGSAPRATGWRWGSTRVRRLHGARDMRGRPRPDRALRCGGKVAEWWRGVTSSRKTDPPKPGARDWRRAPRGPVRRSGRGAERVCLSRGSDSLHHLAYAEGTAVAQ